MHTYRICFALLVLVLAGKISAQDSLNVSVAVQFGDQPLTIDSSWHVTPAGDSVKISRFVCYVSGFTVDYADGHSVSESDSYHLIDASEPGTLQFALKNVPAGAITGIRFHVGVDSAKSVSGAFDGDLDPARGMYWAWNSGYINAKLEGTSPSCATPHHAFEFHIGGYLPHQRTLRPVFLPVSPAAFSTRILLIADVSSWFAETELAKKNSIVMPGAEAVRMADTFTHLFYLREP